MFLGVPFFTIEHTGVSTVWKMGKIHMQLRIQPGNDSSKLWKENKQTKKSQPHIKPGQ